MNKARARALRRNPTEIVELDGGQHANQVGSDAERTAWLKAQGFRVLRFWNHQVLNETEAVRETIREALLQRG